MRELRPGEAVALADDVTLSVGKTLHTDESLAVKIEPDGQTIGYTGDAAWTDDLPRFFGGVDVLVAECSYIESRAECATSTRRRRRTRSGWRRDCRRATAARSLSPETASRSSSHFFRVDSRTSRTRRISLPSRTIRRSPACPHRSAPSRSMTNVDR